MRQVILQIDVTLDGFIATPSGDTSWVTADEAMAQDASDLLAAADTILLGRVAYQMFMTYWPFPDSSRSATVSKIAHQINTLDKIVFSKTLTQAAWGDWNNARVIHGNIADEINALKASPGKNMILYAGGEIISTFIQLGLIDTYRLKVHPAALGTGMPIFKSQLPLRLVNSKTYATGAVLLDYVPVKSSDL